MTDHYAQPYYRTITVHTSEGSTLQGQINMSGGQRLSDLFTRNESPFIIMVNVCEKNIQGKTLFINKNHIVWVEPED